MTMHPTPTLSTHAVNGDPMKRLTIVALGALALGGCTGAHIKQPSVCDGKHRRPANLYGSVLPTLPVPLPASQARDQSLVAPGPGGGPATLSPPPAPPVPDALEPSAPSVPSVLPVPPAPPRTSDRGVSWLHASC